LFDGQPALKQAVIKRDKGRNIRNMGQRRQRANHHKQVIDRVTLASAAHELKNPVEAMTNLVYLLEQHSGLDEGARAYVEQLRLELQQMRHVLSQTLEIYRVHANPTLVSLPELLGTIIRFYSHKIGFKQIQVETRYEGDGVVRALSEDLRQLFSNLVINALEALQVNGRLTVHIYESLDWSNAHRTGIRVVIADNGLGVLPEHRDKIMSRRFFTTKGEKGTGLGLRICADIVRKAGGSIRFRSSSAWGRRGTVFSVFLPTPLVEVGPAA
jgi:signal transduction histidine kinase